MQFRIIATIFGLVAATIAAPGGDPWQGGQPSLNYGDNFGGNPGGGNPTCPPTICPPTTCPAGQSCQPPCPGTCPAGQSCQPPPTTCQVCFCCTPGALSSPNDDINGVCDVNSNVNPSPGDCTTSGRTLLVCCNSGGCQEGVFSSTLGADGLSGIADSALDAVSVLLNGIL